AAGIEANDKTKTQGLTVGIGNEPMNPYIESPFHFLHFEPRKTGFHEEPARGELESEQDVSLVELAMPGGFGTWDENYEALRRDHLLLQLGKAHYQPIMDKQRNALKEEGILDQIRTWPFTVDTVQEALRLFDKYLPIWPKIP